MRGEVDVIIAVHDAARPIERALARVLRSQSVRRAIVVCHDLDSSLIAARIGEFAGDERVLLAEHRDGIRSPAGPFNHGLDLAEARYVSVMGSDDTVADGALDDWHALAVSSGAHMVIAPLRHADGARVPTPPTRRTRGLQGVRDRLAFRTAPLGLVSRERFGHLRFTEGLATGEDLAYSTRIWFSGAEIVAASPPAYYLVHDDGVRVTFSRRPLREDLLAVSQLLTETDIRALTPRQRKALAVKLWRVNLFGGVHYRAGSWGEDDRGAAHDLAVALTRFSPEGITALSRAEGALRTALLDPATPDARVDDLSRRRRRFVSFDALIPVHPGLLLARDAPLRFSIATWLVGRS